MDSKVTKLDGTVLTLALAVLLVSTSYGANSAPQGRRTSPRVHKSLHYSFPDENNFSVTVGGVARESKPMPLGRSASSRDPFPGVQVGDTYYDYQHNGRMTRMVDWGNDVAGGEGFMIHFLWMRLATAVQEDRHYAYNVYRAGGGSAGTFFGQISVQSPGEYAGYVSLDVTDDGRAVLGGHNNQGGGYQAHTYWDFGPGFVFFGMNRRVPDSVVAAGTGQDPQDSLKSAIWPSIRYHETPGKVDPVLHVFTQVSEPGAGDPQAIIYFHKVGADDTGEWDYPPYVVDTVFNISQDVACSNTDGKMALVWIASRPEPGDCDTCSSSGGLVSPGWDNDLYYQISYDYGATFSPRVNLTQNVDGEDGYRPYTDLQPLITNDNDLHIVWGARVWPADAGSGGAAGLLRGRVSHWGENLAAGNIRTAANLEWDQEYCNGGAWQLNGSKMNVGECDGKLYVIWTQFNDPNPSPYYPFGIMNDCHNRALAGTDVVGAANGELYLSVSQDFGVTWDGARNLTNTHTPGCDSVTGVGGECRSEHWSSMNRHGTDLSGDMSGAEIIDPSCSYTGAYFLDVQYVADPDPGGIVQDEGTWQQADVRWFRLACVEPIPTAIFNPSWWKVDYPEYVQHGLPYFKTLTIENSGCHYLLFTFTIIEDPGPYSNWITLSPFLQGEVTVLGGYGNTDTGTVTLNAGGIVNAPGTIVHLTGRLVATGNHISSPDTLEISFWVADTLIEPSYDTISTGCLALVVANTGNMGNQRAGHVNLDYFDYGECDDLEGADDSIPGDATVYLYDGSPVVCWSDGDSVICNWSLYGDG